MHDAANYPNAMRVFQDGRMAPWEPEHAEFIRKELLKLAIEDEGASAALKELYDAKLQKYLSEQPKPPEEVSIEEEKRKPGRPKKL